MAIKHIDAHWRDSGRTARFFMVDARAAFPLLIFLVHMRVSTFIIAMIFVIIFGALEYFGFTVLVFLRTIRTVLAGKRKYSRPWWREDKLRW